MIVSQQTILHQYQNTYVCNNYIRKEGSKSVGNMQLRLQGVSHCTMVPLTE